MVKIIKLFPRVNKCNNQINFQLTKKSLSKKDKERLSRLKWIKLNEEDFEWED